MPLDSIQIQSPPYYHREYTNDLGKNKDASYYWLSPYIRIGVAALPILSYYKGSHFPISVGMGGLRVWTHASKLLVTADFHSQLFQTTTAIIALGATVFAHPLGMLITTGQDLILEINSLIDSLNKGETQKALESCLNLLNNSLYFAIFFYSGLGLSIASLALQIALGLYQSHAEFKQRNFIEATGHLGMALVRGKELAGVAKQLDFILR